jgi:membrane protease subunit (stomatin/prohibitin family)
MALMDFIKKQFIDILQWTESGDGTLAWRFPMAEMEIQNGASLTVRDSQLALFVNEGTVADVFAPGMYKLTTQTLPVLTYLKNWDKLFESPFKSDLYFFSTRTQLDQKWGTPNPITIRDKEFGIVRMRAFGIYSYHLSDAKAFYQKISGTRDAYTREELEGQLRNTMVAGMTDLFGESGVPFIDMAASQDEFGKAMFAKMTPMFAEYGLTLDSLVVQNVSLPEELQKILDQKIGMNMIGDMGPLHPVSGRQRDSRSGKERGRHGRHGRRSRRRRRFRPGHGAGDGVGHAAGGGWCACRRRRARRRCGLRRRRRRDAGKTARAGRKGHPQPGRIRRQESGIAQETELTATTWR